MRTRNGAMFGKYSLIFLILILTTAFVFTGCQNQKAAPAKKQSKEAKEKKSSEFDVSVSLAEYPAWIKKYLNTRKWKIHKGKEPRLNREILNKSTDLGIDFMIKNQKPEGNFNYQYDWVKKEMDHDDNQVRQAGALWGIALANLHKPSPALKKSLDKGLKFFFNITEEGPEPGTLTIAYPKNAQTSSGTIALVALSIIEYLRADQAKPALSEAYKKELNEKLDGYLKMLTWMKLDNKHFSKSYSLLTKTKKSYFSPYFDGETMLCLTKAAKYTGRKELIPIIEDSAMTLAKEYTIDEWKKDPDSAQTKGFFQWSCMTFWEYQDAGYKDAEVFGDYVLSMVWWMIHTHETLKRRKGTGYAYEGIIHGYKLAKDRNLAEAVDDIGYTIDRGIYKLTSWQVGGPLAFKNKFLTAHPTDDKLAIGGHMNHKRQAPLRIDVTQHTLHAQLLALQYVYPE